MSISHLALKSLADLSRKLVISSRELHCPLSFRKTIECNRETLIHISPTLPKFGTIVDVYELFYQVNSGFLLIIDLQTPIRIQDSSSKMLNKIVHALKLIALSKFSTNIIFECTGFENDISFRFTKAIIA